MAISVYDISVGTFIGQLGALSSILRKAEESAAERKFDPEALLSARLAPDMFTLRRQVQLSSDHAKGAPSRLAGRDVPKFEDVEKSFEDLQGRIERTIAHLRTFAPADFEGAEDRTIELATPTRTLTFTGRDYLLGFALPNFYFHVTTAYAICRHNGVSVGKRDFVPGR